MRMSLKAYIFQLSMKPIALAAVLARTSALPDHSVLFMWKGTKCIRRYKNESTNYHKWGTNKK
jgi:hypothetical protein